MASLPERSVAARTMRFSFVCFVVILLLLAAGFALPLPTALRNSALGLVALAACGVVYVYAAYLRTERYRYGSGLIALAIVMVTVPLPFIVNAMAWAQLSLWSAVTMMAAHMAVWALGYRVGRLRLDHDMRTAEFGRFVRFGLGAYYLRDSVPKWAVYGRRFEPPVLERVYKVALWVFGALVLALAVLGAGAATVLLELVSGVDGPLYRSNVAMACLAMPSLAALGYGSAAVFAAVRDWVRLTRGKGREVWPKDDAPRPA